MTDETYIAGQQVKLVKPGEETKPTPVNEQMDSAMQRIAEKKGQDFEPASQGESPVTDGHRNVDAAYADAQERAARRQEREADKRAQAEEQERLKVERSIHEAANWNQDDQQLIGGMDTELKQLMQAKQNLTETARYYQQHPDKLTSEVKKQFQETEATIQQRALQLRDVYNLAESTGQQKQLHAERQKLLRDVPGLADPDTKGAFKSWLIEKGVPKDKIDRETDRAGLGVLFQQYQGEKKEERQRRLNRPRKPAFRNGPLGPGGSTPDSMTVDDAYSRLKKSGSMGDAMNALTLKRERAREESQS